MEKTTLTLSLTADGYKWEYNGPKPENLIVDAKAGDDKDSVIFTYKDGTTQTVKLEVTGIIDPSRSN